MVVLPRRQYRSAVSLLHSAIDEWKILKDFHLLRSALSDYSQRKVVGILGSSDVTSFPRDFLAFLANFDERSSKLDHLITVNEWPQSLFSISLLKGRTRYTLLIGVPCSKAVININGGNREEKQTAYTCQIWGSGIE